MGGHGYLQYLLLRNEHSSIFLRVSLPFQALSTLNGMLWDMCRTILSRRLVDTLHSNPDGQSIESKNNNQKIIILF